MPDCVVDATVIAFANGDIAARKPGNVLDRRLAIIEQVARGANRLRYNRRLLHEYQEHVREFRNDLIEAFFQILDTPSLSILVNKSSLARQCYATATKKCRWPKHDQHLLAAAMDGLDPSIFVTEDALYQCATEILRHFRIHVVQLT